MTLINATSAIFVNNVEVGAIRTKEARMVEKFIAEKALVTPHFVDIFIFKLISTVETTSNGTRKALRSSVLRY